jgi:ribosome-associated heat shock protein Hsp15
MAVSDTPVRLDIWLDVACLFKTRSAAQQAIKAGKVDVNGQRGRPNRDVRPGDTIVISRPMGRKQQVVVRGTATQHLAKADARALLLEDVTPPPSPEELAFKQLLRDTRSRPLSAGAPDRRERRVLRQMKQRS